MQEDGWRDGGKVPSSDPRATRNSQVWPGALARASLDFERIGLWMDIDIEGTG
jgi:hypothetical protein